MGVVWYFISNHSQVVSRGCWVDAIVLEFKEKIKT